MQLDIALRSIAIEKVIKGGNNMTEVTGWITVNGQHVPLMKGESKANAVKKAISKQKNADEDKKEKQIAANKKEADDRKDKDTAENKKETDDRTFQFGKSGNIKFGEPSNYKAYRAGGVFNSPLGFLTFGLEKVQSNAYQKIHGKPTEEFTLQIKKPLHVTGTADFTKIQDDLCKKYTGKSLLAEKTQEGMRAVLKEASAKIYKEGYDSILMERKDLIAGESDYEIGVLNQFKESVIKKGH